MHQTRPTFVLPPGSVECHSHVYDPDRFPYLDADLGERPHDWRAYRETLMDRLGFERVVVVQAAAYGPDNRATLEAVQRIGPERARAVVITRPDETEAGFRALHADGARGLRFFLGARWLTLDDLPALAERIAPLGWHVVLQHPDGTRLADWVDLVTSLPCPVVIDHLGRIPPGPGRLATATHPAFQALLRMVDGGNVYVKISGLYYSSAVGWPYPDVEQRVRALTEARPDRLLYGQNWPHPRIEPKPDDARELDLLPDFVPDPAVRRMILVDNPQRLYFAD